MNLTGNSTGSPSHNYTPFIGIMVISLTASTMNLFFTVVIFYVPKLRQRRSNKFLLNLIISNMVVSLFMFFFSAIIFAINDTDYAIKNTYKPPAAILIMFAVILMLSIINLILLSLDRLLTVTWTFRYLDSVSTKHIYYAIVTQWVSAILYFIILLILILTISHDTTRWVVYISFDATFIVGFITLAVSNSLIFKVARKQINAIAVTSVRSTAVANKETEKHLKHREYRLALINIGIVVKFVLFWLPTVASMTYHQRFSVVMSRNLAFVAYHLTVLNCALDPAIYIFLSRDIRKEIYGLFHKESSLATNTT